MSQFAKATIVRALRTLAQTVIAGFGASIAIDQVDWEAVALTSAGAVVLSICTSLVTGLPEVPEG